jgi:hypothetical protein
LVPKKCERRKNTYCSKNSTSWKNHVIHCWWVDPTLNIQRAACIVASCSLTYNKWIINKHSASLLYSSEMPSLLF